MTKIKILLVFVFLLHLDSKAQQFNFVKTIAGTANDKCNAIASDQGDYLYVCGSFEGYLGIANMLSLTAVSGSDAFLVKMEARSGKPVWAKAGSGTSNDAANALALDKSGNIYVVGVFNANTKFENTVVYGSGYENMFFAKFNPQGGLIWLKMAGGAAQSRVLPKAVKIGEDGKLYITGSISSSVTFGSINVKSSNPKISSSDVFIAQYDTGGTALNVWNFGKSGLSEGRGIETDKFGNMYVSGTHSDTLIAGKDTLIGNNSNLMFVLALDKNGKSRWLKRHSNSLGNANAMKFNSKGQLFVVGESNRNGFLMEVDTADGKSKWFKETKGGYTSSKAIAIDKRGNIYVTGGVRYGGIFDSILIKTECACTNNGFDMFTARYNDTGKVIWVQQGGGGVFDDIGQGIDIDRKGDVYVVGIYASNAYFGPYTLSGFSGQQTEGFAAKINTRLVYGRPLTSNICTNHGSIPFIYTLNARMHTGNKVKFEMSDTGGIFSQATLLELSDTGLGSDTIQLPMPLSKLPLLPYQVRITTSAPIDTFYLADGLVFQPIPQSKFTVDDSLQCIINNVFKFTNSSSGPAGTLNYKWNLDDGTIAVVKNINPYTYKKAGKFKASLETTTSKQCKDTMTKWIIVQSKPLVSIEVNDSIQCQKNNQFDFTDNSIINDSAFLKIFWNFGDGKTDSLPFTSHRYEAEGMYTVKLRVSGVEGCKDSGFRKVWVEESNIERVKVEANCEGDSGLILPRNINLFYHWFRNDTLMADSAKYLIINQSGIYKFTPLSFNGCRDTSERDTFVFHSKPEKPYVINKSDTISVNEMYSRYQWYKDGQILSGDTMYKLIVSGSGAYFVKVFNTFGCMAYSDTMQLNLNSITNPIYPGFKIYPNPGDGFFHFTNGAKFASLEVLDIYGHTLVHIDPNSSSIDLRNFPMGTYVVRAKTLENRVYHVLLIKN